MIKEYLTYIQSVKGLTENSVKAYAQDFRQFVCWAQAQQIRWSTLSRNDVDNYLLFMDRVGLSAATRCRRISALRQLCQWAHHKGLLSMNPFQYAQSPKKAHKLPQTIDKAVLLQYLETPALTQRSIYIHALVALLYDTGIRIQEAIEIRWDDVNTSEHSILIHGKGRKERKVYYTQRIIPHVGKVATIRKGYMLPMDCQYLWRKMLHEEITGLHPHMIRHTFASDMLNAGASLECVSALLGHESIKTTQIYAQLNNNSLRAAYHQFH